MKWNIFDEHGNIVDMIAFITPQGYRGLYKIHLWEFGIVDKYLYLHSQRRVDSLRRTHKIIEVK
jgi:hypothetical protein